MFKECGGGHDHVPDVKPHRAADTQLLVVLHELELVTHCLGQGFSFFKKLPSFILADDLLCKVEVGEEGGYNIGNVMTGGCGEEVDLSLGFMQG